MLYVTKILENSNIKLDFLTHVTFCLNVVIPIVKFANGIERPVKAEKWVIRTGNGGQVTRTQLPLQLAWAISIHKSQVIQFQLLILSKYPSVFVTTLTLIFDLLKTVKVEMSSTSPETLLIIQCPKQNSGDGLTFQSWAK